MSIQALREQRAVKAKAVKELVEKKDWNPANDQPVYDALMAEIDSFDAQIKNIVRVNELYAETAINENMIEGGERAAKNKKSEGSRIFAKWLRGGVANLTPEEAAYMARVNAAAVRNAQAEGTQSAGGYTVSTEVAAQVIEALKQYGGMRKLADVFSTVMGNPIAYPTSDGTSEMGEIVAENGSASELDATFGTVGLSPYKFSSKIIPVPWELLQDSSVDVEAFVRRRLVTRLGRIGNNKFTVGSGTNEPNGLVTAVGVGVTGATGETLTVIYDDLVNLQHSVDPAYRDEGNCKFMMHDSSLRVIRKIKDGYGRPIFVPGYEEGSPGGSPDRILGDPIQINQDTPVMAANAKSITYGDHSYYKIRDVLDIQMFRFTDSVYTSKGQVGFLAWSRSGGAWTDVGGAVKAFQNSAT